LFPHKHFVKLASKTISISHHEDTYETLTEINGFNSGGESDKK
jgi:hypothetical protein